MRMTETYNEGGKDEYLNWATFHSLLNTMNFKICKI